MIATSITAAASTSNRTITQAWSFRGHEFNLDVGELNEKSPKNVSFYYMLLSSSRPRPADIGDEVTLRLMVHSTNRSKRDKIADELQHADLFPANRSAPFQWGPWRNVWVGGSVTLSDLGKKDYVAISKTVANGIRLSYAPLHLWLQKLATRR